MHSHFRLGSHDLCFMAMILSTLALLIAGIRDPYRLVSEVADSSERHGYIVPIG